MLRHFLLLTALGTLGGGTAQGFPQPEDLNSRVYLPSSQDAAIITAVVRCREKTCQGVKLGVRWGPHGVLRSYSARCVAFQMDKAAGPEIVPLTVYTLKPTVIESITQRPRGSAYLPPAGCVVRGGPW